VQSAPAPWPGFGCVRAYREGSAIRTGAVACAGAFVVGYASPAMRLSDLFRFGRPKPPDASSPRPASSAAVPSEDADRLGPELETALLRELSGTWSELNQSFLRGALRRPVLRLCESSSLLGRWDGRRRSVEISLPLLLRAPWGAVVEVLKHEMAHQYADEVLGATDETAHGPAFRSVCERLGITPEATGPTEIPSEVDPGRARVLKRVADLLALARSPNRHEAEAAAAAAQRLMLKYNIEQASDRASRRYDFVQLGTPSGRVPESEHILASILAEHFFVEAIWVPAFRPRDGKHGTLLEVCGTRENLQIASYVHAFLRGTAERLWREHRRAMGLRSNRDRRTFVAGVMEGFRERLKEDKLRCREQGLVWLGDADLQRYHRVRHPYIRSVRLQGHSRNEARAHGRAAGRRIVLQRALTQEQPTSAARPPSTPKSLPPARG
jgi:hypothetical protein